MGSPSSQIMMKWLLDHISGSNWHSLPSLLSEILTIRLAINMDQAAELAEQNIQFIAGHLRDELEKNHNSGCPPLFELDEEDPPYIRSIKQESTQEIFNKLKKIPPEQFEEICSKILSAIGAKSINNAGTDDGGIDFIGLELIPNNYNTHMPINSKILILGQAKRYKQNNSVTTNELRQFVGACKAKVREFTISGKIGPLTPIIYAFWTTSYFDPKALDYAHQMGIWFMDGYSIADHLEKIGLHLP